MEPEQTADKNPHFAFLAPQNMPGKEIFVLLAHGLPSSGETLPVLLLLPHAACQRSWPEECTGHPRSVAAPQLPAIAAEPCGSAGTGSHAQPGGGGGARPCDGHPLLPLPSPTGGRRQGRARAAGCLTRQRLRQRTAAGKAGTEKEELRGPQGRAAEPGRTRGCAPRRAQAAIAVCSKIAFNMTRGVGGARGALALPISSLAESLSTLPYVILPYTSSCFICHPLAHMVTAPLPGTRRGWI